MDKLLVEKILAASNAPDDEFEDVPEELFKDVPCITADITTSEIVDLIRECRAGV